MESWTSDIPFERVGPIRRAVKRALVNPLVNYLPTSMFKALLRFSKSELAAQNWNDPGGWKSMVISYNGHPKQIADKLLVNLGSMSMALRNRRRLGARVLVRLIEQSNHEEVHVLCLGAGPGRIIIDALLEAPTTVFATLVDISSDAFDYGRQLAKSCGLSDRVKYIQGDVRNVKDMLKRPPAIVKMLGICEYLSDEQISDIVKTVAEVMPADASIVFNSISKAHGTDRFCRRVLGLHMIHRTPEQLQELMAPAGFGDFVSIPEPLGVYHVIMGRLKHGARR
jgi:SAM-dependent methyltransferase